MRIKLFVAISLLALLVGCATPVDTVFKSRSGASLPVQVELFLSTSNQPKPTVVIAHGSGGVKPSQRVWASLAQSWGYNAVVIDHYTLRGIGDHTGRIAPGAAAYDRAQDMNAVANWIKQQPWHQGKLAVVGFSQGGAGVFSLISSNTPYAAAIAFYPACAINAPPGSPQIPTQVHLAESDNLAYIGYCTPALNRSQYEYYIYKNATHVFDVNMQTTTPFTHRYDPVAARESQQRSRDFLEKNLK
jgi:dienelactone hydrolase